jgi:hypothetical protein
MLLKTQLDVPVSMAAFKEVFSWEPERCFGGLSEAAREEGDRLLAEVGLHDGASPLTEPGSAALHLGGLLIDENLVSVPLELEVEGGGAFPSLQGTLDAAWLGEERTYLSLSLQYEMPPAMLEERPQRALFHRVVEVVAQHFLVKLSECLCVSCAVRPAQAAPRPGGSAP